MQLTVWYKTKFGSQNFGYQIWFCTRLFNSFLPIAITTRDITEQWIPYTKG